MDGCIEGQERLLASLYCSIPHPPIRIPHSKVPPRGVEQAANSTGKVIFLEVGGAECGALGAPSAPADPDLAELIQCWPDLSDAARAGVLAMARAAAG